MFALGKVIGWPGEVLRNFIGTIFIPTYLSSYEQHDQLEKF